MKKSVVIAGCVTAGVIGFYAPNQLSAHPSNPTQSKVGVWKAAHHLLHDAGVPARLPWDGSYSDHKRFCVETFNPSRKSVTYKKHAVPGGFYLKFCDDGNFYVNDGVPFKHMRRF